MTVILYGAAGFTSTQRVQVVLTEINVPWKFHNLDFANGEHKTPEHIARHPFGQIPVLTDGEFTVYESRAICKYLVMKFETGGSELMPSVTDLQATAHFEQAAQIETCLFEKHISGLVWEKHMAPMYNNAPNEVIIKNSREGLSRTLDVYETILKKRSYIASETFSLIDIYHLPWTQLLFAIGEEDLITSRKNVADWWQRISTRESWRKVMSGT